MASETTVKHRDADDKSQCWHWCRFLIVILTPILCSIVLIIPTFHHPKKEATKDYFALCMGWLYVLLVTAVYNRTCALTISLVAYIPYVVYPLLGICNSKQLSLKFMTSVSMLHFGSLVFVLAVHHSGLRNKMTLFILKQSSGSIRGIYIRVFLMTVTLAMMINSCFAAFLMAKVVDDLLEHMKMEVTNGTLGDERMAAVNEIVDIVDEIEEGREAKGEEGNNESIPSPAKEEKLEALEVIITESANEMAAAHRHPHLPPELQEAEPNQLDENLIKDFVQHFDKENELQLLHYGGVLLYAVSVAANIGGIFLPAGSPVGEDFFTTKYLLSKSSAFKWSLMTWVVFTLPLVLILSTISLCFLFQLHFSRGTVWRTLREFCGVDEKGLTTAVQSPHALTQLEKLFSHKYAQVKAFNFQEAATFFLLCLFTVLSLTRWPVLYKGWAQRVKPREGLGVYIDIQNSCIMILIVLVLFMSPKTGIGIFKGPRGFSSNSREREGNFIGWKSVQSKFPWNILLLIAGSRAMGLFSKEGVSPAIAAGIARIASIKSSIEIRGVMMVFITLLNQLLPNPGTTVVAQNVWDSLLSDQRMDKKFASLIITVIPVASLTFMFPTASVPNAIVIRTRREKLLSPQYFFKAGLFLFILTLIPTFLYALAWTENGVTFV